MTKFWKSSRKSTRNMNYRHLLAKISIIFGSAYLEILREQSSGFSKVFVCSVQPSLYLSLHPVYHVNVTEICLNEEKCMPCQPKDL